MYFCNSMRSKDAVRWMVEVAKEKERFHKCNYVTIINQKDLPSDAKVFSITWAMKQKASGELRSQLNARGLEQLEGQYYFSDTIAAPVTNPNTIQILLTLM